MNRCRRCGNILEKKSDLWCDYCRKRVDEEINHETSRPLEWYFSYYYKNRGERKRDLFGQVGEFGSGKTLNRMLRGG